MIPRARAARDGGEAMDDLKCTRCCEPITDGYMIGDGDGTGQRFAHPECYRQYPGASRRAALRGRRDDETQ